MTGWKDSLAPRKDEVVRVTLEGSAGMNPDHPDKHVEILLELRLDQGSIPCISIKGKAHDWLELSYNQARRQR